jgi:hypothetical protein
MMATSYALLVTTSSLVKAGTWQTVSRQPDRWYQHRPHMLRLEQQKAKSGHSSHTFHGLMNLDMGSGLPRCWRN